MSDAVTLLIDGEAVPVTHLFDADGDEVATWAEAVKFVAGPLPNGQWLADRCEDYREAKLP